MTGTMENGFDQINKKAFEFVALLEERESGIAGNCAQDTPRFVEPMIGEGEPILVLQEVHDLMIHQTDLDGNILYKFADVAQKSVGFHPDRYKAFKSFVESIYEQNVFKEKSTLSFIEKLAFKWMIDVYAAQRASQDLTSWLLAGIEEEFKEYEFYFKLVPLMIQRPFAIGTAQVTYFDEAFLKAQKEKFFRLPGKTLEEFDGIFSQYKDTAILKIVATGIEDRALETAGFEAELAMDVLKCFLYEYAMYEQHKIPDLETRMQSKRTSSLLYNSGGEGFNIRMSFKSNGGVMPVSIDEKLLDTFDKRGFGVVSAFVKNRRTDEVYYMALDVIRSLGDALTTADKHERVVKLITLFEAVLIDGRTRKGKGENILKSKLLPKICKDPNSVTAATAVVRYFYNRRDEFLHHGREEPIEWEKLNKLTRLAFTFMLFMVNDGARFQDVEDFYNYLHDTPAQK